jgi:hypothetical protein
VEHVRARDPDLGGVLIRAYPALVAAIAGVGSILTPRPAEAQWLESFGQGWVDVRLYYHDTTREFGPESERRDFFADGHAVTSSVYLTAATGLIDGLDTWIQLPIHHLQFDDAGGEREQTGIGDLRLYLRADPSLVGLSTLPVALRGGIKIPGAEFPVDAEVIPLTEGQVDLELFLEVGHSFHPAPFYAMGWVGHRWRMAKGNIRDPGDEVLAYVAVGGDLGSLFVWKIAAEGMWGGTPILERLPVENARRRMMQVFPTFGVRVGPGAIEFGGRVPFQGRNLPAGPALVIGYFFRWDARGG